MIRQRETVQSAFGAQMSYLVKRIFQEHLHALAHVLYVLIKIVFLLVHDFDLLLQSVRDVVCCEISVLGVDNEIN